MAGEYSTGSVIDSLISNNEGQRETVQNNKPLKRIINNKEYYYNANNVLFHTFVCHLLEKNRLIIDWFNYRGTDDDSHYN